MPNFCEVFKRVAGLNVVLALEAELRPNQQPKPPLPPKQVTVRQPAPPKRIRLIKPIKSVGPQPSKAKRVCR